SFFFFFFFFFFFQAEDGIRDKLVTGVQTCALPISGRFAREPVEKSSSTTTSPPAASKRATILEPTKPAPPVTRTLRPRSSAVRRSEERRVGKECRYRWSP